MKEVNRKENNLTDWPRRAPDGGNSELDPTSKSSVESIYEGNRKYHVADKMYGIIPIFKEIGVDCDVLNQYIDWCKNAWPNIDFETLKIENCIIDDENSKNVILIEANENWKYLDNGSNQGTAWRGTNFNDSSWNSGEAELGYGNSQTTTVGYGNSSSNKYPTTYFRKSFNVSNPAQYNNLEMEAIRDDGMVVYLNGVEVWRDNISGSVDYLTLANSPAINGSDETTWISNIISEKLVNGTNVIAVEIHQQAPTSSDISFNFKLTSTINEEEEEFDPKISIIKTSDAAEGISNATFTVSLDDEIVNISGNPITGDISLTGTAVGGSDYTNVTSFAIPNESRSVLVTIPVINDTKVEGTETIIATISATSIGSISANNRATALIYDDDDENSNNVILIEANENWKYLDNGSNQGTAWRGTNFNDSSWNSGEAELGYGDNQETLISYGNSSSNKHLTSYFRKSFNIANPNQYGSLKMEAIRDDGIVVYLNGNLVWSNNMPSTWNYSTIATKTVGRSAETTWISKEINNSLRSGKNVIAVEIHQRSASSSDLSFNFKLASTINKEDNDRNWLIDNCDSEDGWFSSNRISTSSNYKEGIGSLKSEGSGLEDFKKTFRSINGEGATALEFWYYADPSKFNNSNQNQVELGSGGRSNIREYNWSIDKSKLIRGWNLIKLNFSDAGITGRTPDIERLNWFRLYREKSLFNTSRIDFIRLTNSYSRSSSILETQKLVSDSNLENEYKLYPNPTKGLVNLLLPINNSNSKATISIINIMGKTIDIKNYKGLREGINQIPIDTQLSPGVYFIKIITKESRRVLKLLVTE